MARIQRTKATTTTAETAAPEGDQVTEQTSAEAPESDQVIAPEDTTTEGGISAPEGETAEDAAAADWIAQWTVTVAPLPDSKADKAGVATIAVAIHRKGKGQYEAAYGALVGATHKEPEMAVRNLMKMTSPKRTPLGEFSIDGLDNEPMKPTEKGDNAPRDPWTYEGPTKAALDDAAAKAAKGSERIHSGGLDIRYGSIDTGKALNAAWSAMGATTEGGVNPPLDMWGRWLNVQTRPAANGEPAGLLYGSAVSKNTASELMFMGSAPENIVSLYPSHLNSAKSFGGWTGEAVRFLARASVSVLYGTKDAAREPGNSEPLSAEPGELSDTLHNFIGTVRDRIEEARKVATTEAARQNKNPMAAPVDAESLLTPSTREDIAAVAIFEWLSRDLPLKGAPDFGVNFPKHKLGKAMVKAWDNAVKEAAASGVTPTTEGEGDDDKAEKETTTARTFADYSDDEAAEHIANMITGARAEYVERVAIVELVQALLDKREQAAEDAAEGAEKEAEDTAASE